MPGVALAAVLVGVAAAWFASAHDLTMLYADAIAPHYRAPSRRRPEPQHRAARDGLAPVAAPRAPAAGLVARAVELGLAAIPVDIACLVIEALSLFSLAKTLTARSRVAWLAVLLLHRIRRSSICTRPGPPNRCCSPRYSLTVAMLARWASTDKPYSGGEIALYCGLPAAAMVLSCYDGWAMAGVATVYVLGSRNGAGTSGATRSTSRAAS